jgi:hypothetical protein
MAFVGVYLDEAAKRQKLSKGIKKIPEVVGFHTETGDK